MQVKSFAELSGGEVYGLLMARSMVFVEEQQCPYRDVDGVDLDCLHVFYEEAGRVLACLRLQLPDREKAVVKMGRVLTVERGVGLGGRLLQAGITAAGERLGARRIALEAQCHARGFYERAGFAVCGEAFDEDGIPHVPMELIL